MSQQHEIKFKDLPEEVLVTVFKQMDFKTLLQSSLVCKKWNKMIGQNSAIMMKIKLVVNLHRKNFQLSPEDLTRNYQMIKIIGLYKDLRILSTLTIRYNLLCVLEIEDCKTKNLLARRMIACSREPSLKVNVDVSHLNCLKSLTLKSRYLTTLEFPKAAQLTKLKISELDGGNSSELIEYLVGQKSLEVLAIRSSSTNRPKAKRARIDHNFKKLLAAQFSLKKLLLDWDYNSFGSEKNFLLFINKFVNTLEELHLEQEYPESVYEMIFEKFRKLNTLKISLAYAPDRNEFFQNLRENVSIRELIISGHVSDTFIQQFFGKLPNIQTLVLHGTGLSKNLVVSISNNLRKLKNLQVEGIPNDAFEGVSIPSLTTITIIIHNYISPKTWKQIVTALPNIKIFNMQCAKFFDRKNIGIITEGWSHLKHVMIGNEFRSSMTIFDLFLRNCKDLKTLKIYEDRSYSEETSTSESGKEKEAVLRDFERAGVQFTFYADDKVWAFTLFEFDN